MQDHRTYMSACELRRSDCDVAPFQAIQVSPGLRQVQACGDGPGQRALGVDAGHGDLAVGNLAHGAGVLAGHADAVGALLDKAGVIEDQHAIARGVEGSQAGHAVPVDRLVVPAHRGEQALKGLVRARGNDRGQGFAVFGGMLAQQAGDVRLHQVAFTAQEVRMERLQEGGQFRQWRAGGMRDRSVYCIRPSIPTIDI